MTASVNFSITVAPAGAVTVTIAPVASLPSPVPAGMVVGYITVTPATWSGSLSLSGANSGAYAIGPAIIVAGTAYAGTLMVGAGALASGDTYAVTVTANP